MRKRRKSKGRDGVLLKALRAGWLAVGDGVEPRSGAAKRELRRDLRAKKLSAGRGLKGERTISPLVAVADE